MPHPATRTSSAAEVEVLATGAAFVYCPASQPGRVIRQSRVGLCSANDPPE